MHLRIVHLPKQPDDLTAPGIRTRGRMGETHERHSAGVFLARWGLADHLDRGQKLRHGHQPPPRRDRTPAGTGDELEGPEDLGVGPLDHRDDAAAGSTGPVVASDDLRANPISVQRDPFAAAGDHHVPSHALDLWALGFEETVATTHAAVAPDDLGRSSSLSHRPGLLLDDLVRVPVPGLADAVETTGIRLHVEHGRHPTTVVAIYPEPLGDLLHGQRPRGRLLEDSEHILQRYVLLFRVRHLPSLRVPRPLVKPVGWPTPCPLVDSPRHE